MLTDEGAVFNGLLISETDEELRIKDQEGIERTFQRTRCWSMASRTSP